MTEAEENLFLLVAQFSYRDRCPRYIVQAVEAVLEEQERNKLKSTNVKYDNPGHLPFRLLNVEDGACTAVRAERAHEAEVADKWSRAYNASVGADGNGLWRRRT